MQPYGRMDETWIKVEMLPFDMSCTMYTMGPSPARGRAPRFGCNFPASRMDKYTCPDFWTWAHGGHKWEKEKVDGHGCQIAAIVRVFCGRGGQGHLSKAILSRNHCI